MFSLIETAKQNRLIPYRYLAYVLSAAPNLDRSDRDWVIPLLPANAPEQCRVPQAENKNDP